MRNKLRPIKTNENLAFRPKVSNYFTFSPSTSVAKHLFSLLISDLDSRYLFQVSTRNIGTRLSVNLLRQEFYCTLCYFWVRVASISTSMSSDSLARLIGLWIDPEKHCGSWVIIRNHTTTVCVPSSSSVSIDRTSA